MNKYRNKKVQVDMYVFDSIAESRKKVNPNTNKP